MARQQSHVGTSPSEQSIIDHDEVTVGATEVALPDVTGTMVLIKADATNAGTVYLGLTGLAAGGSGSGLPLAAGEFTPYIPLNVAGLSEIVAIASEASQKLHYLVFN